MVALLSQSPDALLTRGGETLNRMMLCGPFHLAFYDPVNLSQLLECLIY